MKSGINTRVTIASVGTIRTKDGGYRSDDSAIGTKDSGYRSVNLPLPRSLWRYKRHSGSVIHTTEDD